MTEYPRDYDDAIADLNEYAIDEHGDERCGWEDDWPYEESRKAVVDRLKREQE